MTHPPVLFSAPCPSSLLSTQSTGECLSGFARTEGVSGAPLQMSQHAGGVAAARSPATGEACVRRGTAAVRRDASCSRSTERGMRVRVPLFVHSRPERTGTQLGMMRGP
eukprot:scaffold897_cov402-Prasinococcus_capsulatus_cf.AAC.12